MKRLGLLNCVAHKDEEQLQVYERDSFATWLGKSEHAWELIEYRVTDMELPDSVDACDVYLLTGSVSGVYDNEPWLPPLKDFILALRETQKRTVGICFGHQMLAHTLGGHAEKSEKGWGIGLHSFEIMAPQPWMSPPLDQAALNFCHQDQVVALPAGAIRLAGNDFCPNAMFILDNQFLGIQGHPEIEESFMADLINVLRDEVGADVSAAAAKTLHSDSAAHDSEFAQWVVNFLAAESN